MASQFPNLLSPTRIGNVEIRNRIISSAHSSNLAVNNRPSEAMIAYHIARARGGVGLIILENSRVHPTTGGRDNSLHAWEEAHIPAYKRLAEAVHEHGAKMFAQLIHIGKAINTMDTRLPLWSASSVQASSTTEITHAMTKWEILELYEWWAKCAVNMKKAGMDGVEIHGGHGYLVQQFLSPLTNFRTDEYGGSARNRARFALELISSLRQAVGRDFVVGVRISADELEPGGIDLEFSSKFAQWLEDSGELDYINVSLSNTSPLSFAQQIADMTWGPTPFVHLAEGIKKATKGIPITAVGRIIDPHVAESIIAEGKADLVCMTRAQIADPEIGRKLMEARPEDIRQCIGCNQGCAGRSHRERTIGCLINPEAGREHELGEIMPAPKPRSVVVVGGGPAGMEAARVAALRGHRVSLYERSDRLGGQINTLVKAPLRQEFGKIVDWLDYQINKLGVEIHLNTEATLDSLKSVGAEAVIMATGSFPQTHKIEGLDGRDAPQIVTANDLLEGRVSPGKKAVLLDGDGHHKSGSTALLLANNGCQVHFVTKGSALFAEIILVSQAPVIHRLKQKHVAFYRDSWIKEVVGRKVILFDVHNRDESTIDDVDLIVSVVPNKPSSELYEALKAEGRVPEVIAVGDCLVPRRAIDAIREGHMAARAL